MLRIYIYLAWHELISNPCRAISPPACLPAIPDKFPRFCGSPFILSFVSIAPSPQPNVPPIPPPLHPFPPPNPNPQRPLIPQRKQRIRLLALPIPRLPLPLQIKRPQQLRNHEPHLAVRDILPDAVARAERERVESGR